MSLLVKQDDHKPVFYQAEKQCDDQIVVGFDDVEHEHLFTTVWFERASGFAAAGADFWL